LLRNSISRALLLAAICLLALAPFFWKGNPSGHDFEFHVYSWMDVLGQWKHGIMSPHWAALAHWGYGEPRFVFYPPASWTLGAALGAALPWKLVPAAYCWIVLTLAAGTMYWLAREWLDRKDAVSAAAFYALNPYHLLIVYWRSAYAELMAAVLLPLALLFLLRLTYSVSGRSESPTLRREEFGLAKWRPFILPTMWLGLTLAAAWVTNLPVAVMVHYSVAAVAIVLAIRAMVRERAWTPEVWRPLLGTAGAVFLGAGLASFYLLPAIYEQGWINVDQVLSPGVRPQDNFLFTTLADADHNRFNRLVSIVAVAEIAVLIFAILSTQRNRTYEEKAVLAGAVPGSRGERGARPWMPLYMWGAASGLIMLPITNFLWQHLPKFRFVQLPFRWLLCMNVSLAILLAMATRHWISRLIIWTLLLVTLIGAGHFTQPPWWDTAADLREMSDFMENGTGYEGTDEYVPAGADASELNKNLPRISDDSGEPIANRMIAWGAAEKHFTVQTAAPENIVVRLFNYPAWKVVVNGKPAATGKTETTGLMVIPVAAGESDVYINFQRTIDRVAGIFVSLATVALFLIILVRSRGETLLQIREPDDDRSDPGR
jgi:hypothetical protein